MRLELGGRVVLVTLSERNLKALLAMLHGSPPDSNCTITYATREGLTLVVSAELDALHYAHPERDAPGIAGAMHPETEKQIDS
ncbi:MAG: hypothetical protein M3R37_05075 [Actinomycetota bacterium]|nr:hypothetical protein [Actinomycetota bacterium]